MNDIIKSFDFEGSSVNIITYRERPVWIAQEVGAALGYSDPKVLTRKIGMDWSDEFEEGADCFKVEGEELDGLKSLVSESDTSGPDATPIIHPRTPSLILLTESGVNLACTLARTDKGKLFRRWLAREVLPALRRGQIPKGATARKARGDGGAARIHRALALLDALRKCGGISQQQHDDELAHLYEEVTGRSVAGRHPAPPPPVEVPASKPQKPPVRRKARQISAPQWAPWPPPALKGARVRGTVRLSAKALRVAQASAKARSVPVAVFIEGALAAWINQMEAEEVECSDGRRRFVKQAGAMFSRRGVDPKGGWGPEGGTEVEVDVWLIGTLADVCGWTGRGFDAALIEAFDGEVE